MAEGVQEDVATRSSLIATTVTSVWLRSVRRASRPMRPYPLIRTRSGAFFFLLNIEHTERERESRAVDSFRRRAEWRKKIVPSVLLLSLLFTEFYFFRGTDNLGDGTVPLL